MNITKEEWMAGLKDGLPIGLGYLTVSFAFGMLAAQGGEGILVPTLMSLTNLTSAGQFAGMNLIMTGGTYLEIVMATLVINIRYMLMSLSLSQKVEAGMTIRQRLLVGFGITDEIFGVASARQVPVTAQYMYGLMFLPIVGWTGGTLLGVAAQQALPAFLVSALGISLYAMFVAIIIPPARANRAVLLVVLIAAGMSCLFRFAPVLQKLSGGWVVILCAVAASAIGAAFYPLREGGSKQ